MARINAREGNAVDAASYYHRAIYGRWPVNAAGHRTQVRLELIELLARQNAKQELLAELLAVEDQVSDTDTQKRLAHLFLAAGSPARSAALFRPSFINNRTATLTPDWATPTLNSGITGRREPISRRP